MVRNSVKNNADANAEVVQSAPGFTAKNGSTHYAGRSKISEVEPHRVVIKLEDAHVNASRHTHIQPAANRSRKTSVVEIFEPVIKLRQVRGCSSYAKERMGEWLERPFRRVVLNLNSTEDVVNPYCGVVSPKVERLLMV